LCILPTPSGNTIMCGILFQLEKREDAIDARSRERFAEALELMAHRGPDNRTVQSHGNALLGHARLSIIDLTEEANQPFEHGPYSLIFNGEIYNYVELRDELKRYGRTFRTTSDTEVLLQAVEEWGLGACARFNGMWAFVILHRETGEWMVSRDRFGQKPLSVFEDDEQIIISSEIAPIRHLVDLEPDWANLGNFVLEGQPAVPNASFYRGVGTFPKAHAARFDPQGGSIEKQRYWWLQKGEERKPKEQDLRAFDDLLTDAVRIRLRSDVPVGILLSGGLDSTIVADKIRELHREGDITAYSYAYRNEHDEIGYARTIAKRFGMPLITGNDGDEKEPDGSPRDRLKQLEDEVRHMGRLHHSPAILASDNLYAFAREHGSIVVLDGQGSDELLSGYETYHIPVILDCVRTLDFRGMWQAFRLWRRHGFRRRLLIFLRERGGPRLRRLMRRVYGYGALVRESVPAPVPGKWAPEPETGRFHSRLNRHLAWQHDYVLENLLFYGDIMAMKNSVENRSPFMDYRLVEAAFAMDHRFKVQDMMDKYVLRRTGTFERNRDVLDRKKVGFAVTFTTDERHRMLDAILAGPLPGLPIFADAGPMLQDRERMVSGKMHNILFRLYQVHLWAEREAGLTDQRTTNNLD
jgi:asparagine synthase (glutamine-hydrolysing)